MKRFYSAVATLLMASAAFAQGKVPQLPVEQRISQIKPKVGYVGTEVKSSVPLNNVVPGGVEVIQNRNVTVTQEIVGITVYDLQSNASVQRRTLDTDAGFVATWTMGLTPSNFDDRGTGYNERTNGGWDEEPYERLENVRTGWPGLIQLENGRRVIINHAGIDTPLHMTYRDAGGDWQETDLPLGDAPGHLWPRVAAGGADGNTIHVVYLSTPEANGGLPYQGQDGALLYARSTDGGDTWGTLNFIHPELDANNFVNFSGDTYDIDARGDKVAFAVFNDFADSFVMISDDNGETWTKRLLVDFPVDNYIVDSGLPDTGEDWDEDGIFQDFYNTDGAGSVLIDLDGKVHVFYGDMYYTDTDLTDGGFNFYPGVNGLSYWNEDLEENTRQTIAFTYDLDGSGALELDGLAQYFVGLAALPTAGITAAGEIFVSYLATMESHSNGLLNFRHIYVVRSSDGGATWTTETACNLTPDVDFDLFENAFASLSRDLGEEVSLIYQRDFEPGLHIRGEEHPSVVNDIVYLSIALDQFEACEAGDEVEYTAIEEALDESDIEIYPNPAHGTVNIVINKIGTANLRILDMNGRVVFERQNALSVVRFDADQLAAGTYVIQVTTKQGVVTKKLMVD